MLDVCNKLLYNMITAKKNNLNRGHQIVLTLGIVLSKNNSGLLGLSSYVKQNVPFTTFQYIV